MLHPVVDGGAGAAVQRGDSAVVVLPDERRRLADLRHGWRDVASECGLIEVIGSVGELQRGRSIGAVRVSGARLGGVVERQPHCEGGPDIHSDEFAAGGSGQEL